MALSDAKVRTAKAGQKPYKLSDERWLFLLVSPSGGKLWRVSYRFEGKQKTLALGSYPEITLADARHRRDEARKMLANGIDPGAAKKAQKAAKTERAANSFEVICREWLESRRDTVEPAQSKKTLARMEKDVFPWIGGKPIADITAPDILAVLRRTDERGARYTAHRMRSEISRVFRYAESTGRADRDPCLSLKGAIPSVRTEHMPAITTPKEAGEMLRAFDGFRGTMIVKTALLLAPLVFVRPGELRQAEWSGIDLDRAEWRYHVSKTKTEHLVPLSRQAVALLRELYPLTGTGRYVFPGRDPQKPMSDAAVNAALRRMGFDTKTEITGHGFRAMARTILHEELHQKPEVIEHQLAHKVPDVLGAAYNRTKFIKERVAMMQAWADYLDKLKAGADVIPLRQATG
ncbi:MAG: integrase arm-type DNA-binding domain-containing protein [Azonexus sp.]|jgi:integrase|uniref:tyrosine-type recombinase/integrase n=1 Tax=Azonexus sp. TaxID=1872668 RepID=UPI00282CB243|nr:integrase arm-type DNA-binding domain-containing protein [Azonexus sp.]MDR0776758.1 integrase arm-type DNA-binding domain-containing protein [Azonexus sp.]